MLNNIKKIKYLLFLLFLFLFIIFTFIYLKTWVVNTSDGLKFYTKKEINLDFFYVNMTKPSVKDLKNHIEIISIMIDKRDLKGIPGYKLIKDSKDSINEALIVKKEEIIKSINDLDDNLLISDSWQQIEDIIGYKRNKFYNSINQKIENAAHDLNKYLKDKSNNINKSNL